MRFRFLRISKHDIKYCKKKLVSGEIKISIKKSKRDFLEFEKKILMLILSSNFRVTRIYYSYYSGNKAFLVW